MKIKIKPILEKTGRYVLSIGLILFFIYLLTTLIIYIKFFYDAHTANTYLSPYYKPEPVKEEDYNTITWLIHMYPPIHNAGAEWMAHAMNASLIAENYKVNVVLNKADLREFERVHIVDKHDTRLVDSVVQHSSVLISHLDMELNAVQTAIAAKRPIVLVMHNNYRKKYLREFMRIIPKNIYLINNSYWIQKYYSEFNINSIVVFPPVYWKEYKTDSSHEYVTLINLNSNKGGLVLYKIAKAMPDVKFLGVKGGYDGQIIKKGLPNLTYMDNTSYIQSIYSKTDILIVPSKEESWGRVAVEAMSSGIPVIAAPTPGLIESCGEAGIFCKRDDIDGWVREIRHLKDDKEHYKRISESCSRRAKELDPTPQLKEMAEWLKGLKWRD